MSNEPIGFRPSPKALDVIKRSQKLHPQKSRSEILNEIVESSGKHLIFSDHHELGLKIRLMGSSGDCKRILALLEPLAEVSRGDRLFKQITFHKEPSQEPFSCNSIDEIVYIEMKLREK